MSAAKNENRLSVSDSASGPGGVDAEETRKRGVGRMKRRSTPKARTPRPAVSRYAAKQARPGTFGEVLTNAMQTQPERLELKARLVEMTGDAA